jgi:hypothetical protein
MSVEALRRSFARRSNSVIIAGIWRWNTDMRYRPERTQVVAERRVRRLYIRSEKD